MKKDPLDVFRNSESKFIRELVELVEIGFRDFIKKMEEKKFYFKKNERKALLNFYMVVSRNVFIHGIKNNIYLELVTLDNEKSDINIRKPAIVGLIEDLLESGLFVLRYGYFSYHIKSGMKLRNPFEHALFDYADRLQDEKRLLQKGYSLSDTEALKIANQKLKLIDPEEFKRGFKRIYRNYENFKV